MLYNNDINVSIIALTDIIVIICIRITIINIALVILNGEKESLSSVKSELLLLKKK